MWEAEGGRGDDEKVLYDAQCSLEILKAGLLSHNLSLELVMSCNSQPYSKNPRIGQKMTLQALHVVPGLRSATWVVSGSGSGRIQPQPPGGESHIETVA